MAIVTMKKFTLLTFQSHKNSLLKELQRFGDVHFRRLHKEELAEMDFLRPDLSPEQISEHESELENVRFAMSKIAPFVQKPKGLKGLTTPPVTLDFEAFDQYLDGYDYKAVCDKAREQDERINAIKAEAARLGAENENLRAWLGLDVAPSEFSGMRCVRALLGTVNKMAAEDFRQSVEAQYDGIYMEMLGVTKDDMAVLLILPEEGFDDLFAAMKEMGFSRTGFVFKDKPADAIEKNKARIGELQKDRQEAEAVLAALVQEYEKLKIASDCFRTMLERERACESFLKSERAVMMEGWIPAEEEPELKDILAKSCGGEFHIEMEEVDKDSPEIPVKLKNNGFARAFEDVTAMYSTPRYNEIDPTPLFAPFYWIFFGFMVADVGFGLVLMAGTFLALKFLNFKEGMRNFLRFFFYLSFGVVAAGCVYGSFFGYTFLAPIAITDAAGSITGYKPLLDTQLDIPLMLVLSIALGLVQIIFGLLVKGYLLVREGKVLDAVFDALFWIITLLGGVCWLVGATGMIPATVSGIGKWCFLGGLAGLALTQGRGGATPIGKVATSLWEVYGISGYVGDLVSYTRIVALGLSGAFIAFSFIKMASILPPGPVGAVFGFIIIFLGETLDLGLGLLGAYVHTCRLQYVEFFGKFYEGGGIPFAPLKCRNDYIQITKQ